MLHVRVLSPNAGENVLNVGIVSHLVVVMLQNQLVALEHKRPTLPQRILHFPGGQILYANIVSSVLLGLPQRREGFLIVPFHHCTDGGGVPHGTNSLLEAEGIAGDAALVTEAQGRVDIELLGKLGGSFGGTHADEEYLGTARRSWEYPRL